MSQRRRKGTERLCDAVSFRVSPAQRKCLERVAEENNIGLCEAARMLLDAGIEARGELNE
jgi:hypothetical protein